MNAGERQEPGRRVRSPVSGTIRGCKISAIRPRYSLCADVVLGHELSWTEDVG